MGARIPIIQVPYVVAVSGMTVDQKCEKSLIYEKEIQIKIL